MCDGWVIKSVAIALVMVAATGVLISGTVSAETQTEMPMNGTGTVEDPYVITNATQLQAIQRDLDAKYTLGSDVDARETANWNGGNGFYPIGEDDEFTGTLDGRGHVIEGLTINRPDEENVAVFRESEGNIGNLDLRDVRVTAGDESAPLVAENYGNIRNVSTSGFLIARGDDIGGIVAFNGGSIVGARSTMNIEGTDYVGGIVGRNSGPLRAAFTDVNITAEFGAGGIAGSNSDTIVESHSHGVLVSKGTAGGFVGDNSGTLSNSYAAAEVQRPWRKGGGVAGGNDGIYVDVYWDLNATGQNTSNANGSPNGTGLTTAQLTGEAVIENTNLDFDQTWRTTDSYPKLNPEIGNETLIPIPEPEPTPTITTLPPPTTTPSSGGMGLPFQVVGGLGAVIALGGSVRYVYRFIRE